MRRNLLVLLLFGLMGCSAPKTNPSPGGAGNSTPVGATASPPPAASAPAATGTSGVKPVECTPLLRSEVDLFDHFISRQLSAADENKLKEACTKNGSANHFCFAIMNYENLEARLHARPASRARSPRVRPKVSGNRVLNWSELKGASTSRLVKALAHARSAVVQAVQTAALAETQCPDNPAIAVAATLEDSLPSRADFGDLARLYEKGGGCLDDPDERENILTRAGLFSYVKKDYVKAAAILTRSAQIDAAKSPRPWYWLYRVQKETGDKSAATATLAKLAEKFPFSFHTVMARLREGQDPDDILSRDIPSAIPRSAKSTVASSLVEEAEYLSACGNVHALSKAMSWAIEEGRDAEPEFRLYLAQMQEKNADFHSSIFILSKILLDYPKFVSRKTLELYFPRAFQALFEKQAQGLDPFLLLSVARQESAFNSRAVSSARAKGLLQLAGRYTHRHRGGKDIFDPETNIRAGARVISQIMDQYERRLQLALGSYNAGPKKVDLWLKRYLTPDPILFIDLMPYKETRSYVALILRNYYWYRRMYSPSDRRLPWTTASDKDHLFWPELPALATSSADARSGLPK